VNWCLLALVAVTGADGQRIDLNPAAIVSLRPVRPGEPHFGGRVRCLIHTVDGKLITASDDCEAVRRSLR
jgi:hypothetical protein